MLSTYHQLTSFRMGNLLSVNAATAAARKSARDAAGGTPATETSGVYKTSTMSQVTGVGATVADAATAATPADEEEQEGKDPPDPEGLWEDDPMDDRIKESMLSPEEKIKFRTIVDRIFDPKAVNGVRVVFSAAEICDVVDTVIPYLKSEPMLIEDVPFDITIVADLHGQLHDLYRVFRGDEKDGKPGWECMKYLFLGDYVDRGRQSLEIVMALFCLKMLHPDRIFLLRGNHEFYKVNIRYGFILDFADRFSLEETWFGLFVKVNEAFCWLSVAAIVGNIYLCVHAGLDSFTLKRHVKAISKPVFESGTYRMIHNMVWSDPAEGLRGSTFNTGRGTSIYYGIDELSLGLYNMDCIALFRGHTMLQSGWKIFGNLCFGIFTATGTTKALNDGAVAVVDAEGKVTFRILKCNPERRRHNKQLKARDAGRDANNIPDNDDDDEDESIVEDYADDN